MQITIVPSQSQKQNFSVESDQLKDTYHKTSANFNDIADRYYTCILCKW